MYKEIQNELSDCLDTCIGCMTNSQHGFNDAILASKSMLSSLNKSGGDLFKILNSLPNKVIRKKNLKSYEKGYNDGIFKSIKIISKYSSKGVVL